MLHAHHRQSERRSVGVDSRTVDRHTRKCDNLSSPKSNFRVCRSTVQVAHGSLTFDPTYNSPAHITMDGLDGLASHQNIKHPLP